MRLHCLLVQQPEAFSVPDAPLMVTLLSFQHLLLRMLSLDLGLSLGLQMLFHCSRRRAPQPFGGLTELEDWALGLGCSQGTTPQGLVLKALSLVQERQAQVQGGNGAWGS